MMCALTRCLGWMSAGALLACAVRPEAAPASIAAEGPQAEPLRVYLLGGSLLEGSPYHPHSDVGKIAAKLLQRGPASASIEVVNLAKTYRESAHFARVAQYVVKNEPRPERAVAFVHVGNHEVMLKYSPWVDLREVGRKLFDEPVVTPAEHARIMAEYGENLAAIVTTFSQAGIRVVLATIGVNLRDWEPNRSVLSDAGHGAQMGALLAQAARSSAAGKHDQAARTLRRASELDPRFAWAWKKLGDELYALGRFEQARQAYQQANDLDGAPSTATSAHNDVIRRLAAEHALPLVDAEEILAGLSAHGVPGFDVFWDNCNPKLEGHVRIAEALARELAHAFELQPPSPLAAGDGSSSALEELARDLGLDRDADVFVLTARGRFFYGYSVLTWDSSERLARARHYLERAYALDPTDPHLLFSLGVLAANERDAARAVSFWRRCHRRDPEHYARRMRDPYMEMLLDILDVEDPLEGKQP